jgi:hypothetical protein
MKSIFGIVGLLLVLAIVGLQMKSQTQAIAPAAQTGKNLEAQVKQQLDATMQTARPDVDDKAGADGK